MIKKREKELTNGRPVNLIYRVLMKENLKITYSMVRGL